ncbi:5751_t:CDS:2 [Acaulospora morrowiae]|uniref:5751_t:CDS:1 n=1 Tax=Acaulospora morrowiae TaxID=94023 RepID=A0A9N8VMS0_9GLOM|nr:5751_t:CDS:2 [Acaulospora morrowiae]
MFKANSLLNVLMKGEASNGTSQTQVNGIVEQLVVLFPDADSEYLRYCVGFYKDNHVERISEKIFNHNKGHYPKIPEGCQDANSVKAKNSYLLQLNEIFPDCEVSHIREKICSLEHSHVQRVTEALLSSRDYPRRLNPSVIEAWEHIRSSEYMKAVRYKLYNDYPNTWGSTIKAVLAENNSDYIRSFTKLKDLTTNNWWTPVINLFKRKSYKEMDNPELAEDIKRIQARKLEEQSQVDYEVAKRVNFSEYENNNQLITCGCCYGDYTFEELTCCNEGHLFCKECISRLVQEGLYGQGSLRGKRINCIESDGCEGYFTEDQLEKTLSSDVFRNYIESLVENSLKQANLSLVQCPFCSYCEADDDDPLKISKTFVIVASIPLAVIPLFSSFESVVSALSMVAIFILPQIVLGMMGVLPIKSWLEEIDNIIRRVKRRRRGNTFHCRNPDCSKVSCLVCNRECRPFHKCYEKEQDSLRLYVEKAMAESVKRTCPKCHVSFTKSDGCNKMTCRCGYVMCYLCRKDLRQESYAHFCDHFRPIPGQKCKKCNKCDLYKTEDEEIVIKEAAAKARAEFIKAHPEAKEANILENTAIGPIVNDDERLVRESFERAIEKIVEYLLP